MKPQLVLCIVILLGLGAVAGAQDVRTETVQFEAGMAGASVQDSLTGYETVHYMLRAAAGQRMTVDMTTDSGAAYFNIFEPGKTPGSDEAMFIGSVGGPSFHGRLPADGDYAVQVYQMRSAARRDEVVRYTLDISIFNDGAVSESDALVPGTDFHAKGLLPCTRADGQPMSQCEFGVKRKGYGGAEITVFWPDGGTRILRFEDGTPTSSDATEELTAIRQPDLYLIRIGSERFEVVDAIISGG